MRRPVYPLQVKPCEASPFTHRARPCRAVVALLLFVSGVYATSGVMAAGPLFDSASTLQITLAGPFRLINRERDKAMEYPGELRYVDAAGQTVRLDAKFSVRGNFRLRKNICSYAQLWVNLKKAQVSGTLFDGQDKLKLVVQCKDSDRYREYLAREHQAYLMFRELSDISLATRMLEVSYVDSDSGASRTQAGFFIQHQKRLANDLGMTVLDAPEAYKLRLDESHGALVALFNYLLANTDYSMIAALPGESCCHNIKVLEDAAGVLYPVPYDFDSTGFVATSYAQPSGGIGQRSVKQRIYRGYCVSDAADRFAIDRLREKRERIYAIITDDPLVSAKSVKRATRYIDQFYEVLDDPRKLQQEITDECR